MAEQNTDQLEVQTCVHRFEPKTRGLRLGGKIIGMEQDDESSAPREILLRCLTLPVDLQTDRL